MNAMLIGIVLLVVGASAQPADKNSHGSSCPRARIRATGQASHGREPVFSAATAGDLEFSLSFAPHLSGRRAVLKIYTPRGHLYQELKVAPEASRPGRREVSARLPVSGTLIVNSSLYGRWSLETHLDGSPERCGEPSLFTITP